MTIRRSFQLLTAASAAIACTFCMTTVASAQSLISWSDGVNLFQGVGNETGTVAQSIVDTSGDFVLAANAIQGVNVDAVMSGDVTTVNDVAFTAQTEVDVVAGFTQNGVTLTASNARATDVAFGSGSITDPDVNAILRGGWFDAATYTLSGLTPGEDYQMQVFTNDARTNGTRDNLWQIGFSDGTQPFLESFAAETAGISLLNNRDPVALDGETSGQYILGTFTADASGSQSFDILGTRNGFADDNMDEIPDSAGNTSQINALQLRLAGDDVVVPGDYDGDSDVDADDIDLLSAQLGNPASVNPLMNLDADDTITLADHDLHITTLVQDANGTGALIGDLNLDGDVDVSQISVGPGGVVNVGDASVLLAGLGTATGAGYADGDLNGDGDIDVSQISIGPGGVVNVGDASILLANLGQSTAPLTAASAVPEPGSVTILALAGIACRLRRQKK